MKRFMWNTRDLILFLIYSLGALTVAFGAYALATPWANQALLVGGGVFLAGLSLHGFEKFLQFHRLSLAASGKVTPEDLEENLQFTAACAETRGDKKEAKRLAIQVREAISQEKFDFMLQPIVSIPGKRVKYYECFTRLKSDKHFFSPHHFLRTAEEERLIRVIDKALLFYCLRMIGQAQKKHYSLTTFCNVSPYSILDNDFYKKFMSFATEEYKIIQDVVFEFQASALKTMSKEFLRRIDLLAKVGVQFSIDNLDDMEALDLKTLKTYCFKFVKMDGKDLIKRAQTQQGLEDIYYFQNLSKKYGITPIITRIEKEEEFLEVLDMNFEYAQGFYFCPPKSKNPS